MIRNLVVTFGWEGRVKRKQSKSKGRAKAEQKQSKCEVKALQKQSKIKAEVKWIPFKTTGAQYFLKLHMLFFSGTGMLRISPEMNGKNRIELSFIYKYELIDMQRIIRIDLNARHKKTRVTKNAMLFWKLLLRSSQWMKF
jgi:hypothetical protein